MFAIRKKEDNWVNLIKLLCIFIVLLGHYNYTDWNGTVWLLYIVKSAVSVMFIYSGYYLCKNKVLDDYDKTKKYLERLAVITVVWVFLYFIRDVMQGEHTIDAVSQTFQNNMYDFTRFDSGHLWYIQNLFLAVVLCGFAYGWISAPVVLKEAAIETMRYVLSASVAVVGLSLDSVLPLNMKVTGHYIRKLSTVVYLCHNLFVQYTFQVASGHGALWESREFFLYSVGTAIWLSVITGIVIIIVSEIKPFRWLKRIY